MPKTFLPLQVRRLSLHSTAQLPRQAHRRALSNFLGMPFSAQITPWINFIALQPTTYYQKKRLATLLGQGATSKTVRSYSQTVKRSHNIVNDLIHSYLKNFR